MRTDLIAFLFAPALIMAGCTAYTTTQFATPSDHPASPEAPAAAMPEPSKTLAGPEPVRAGSGDGPGTANTPHDHGAMSATDREAPAAQAPQQATANAYVCPMHPEVTSNEPGKCPKCGMKLVKNEQSGGHGDH